MSRIVLLGIFLLVLASVVDGSSSSSRRSSRIRGSPRKPMSGLFRGLCPLFRESAIRTEDESVINGRESVVLETSLESTTVLPVTEPSTVPTTTEPIIDTGSNGTETAAKRCFYGMKNNTEVLPEVINPEVFNVTLAECTDICDKNVSCIDVESYGKTPQRYDDNDQLDVNNHCTVVKEHDFTQDNSTCSSLSVRGLCI
ncbi:hypothetical protein LOTGIDRAFT_233801 [Lottia gigantea]|uniref:Apple domain-containing protein n=1 Tax=Lottia gigantea TaxID=225164 RepID=V3ZG98_LOTGI|nr:hypothetical protein LOTGIDRAFT_233801 [Lottia gigantea]ESO90248.1 hypothetical protein LOTGIDRAFT_233801 [Lottia gigantea]